MTYLIECKNKLISFVSKKKNGNTLKRINDMATALQVNTHLAKEKYQELIDTREKVTKYLECLDKEKFEEEFTTIDSLTQIKDKDKKSMKNSLTELRDKGIKELEPLISTSENLQGHLLVTMNKVQIQAVVLVSKGKLLNNANLQLDTMEKMELETDRINKELKTALNKLDNLNSLAIGSLDTTKQLIDNTGNVVDKISNKFIDINNS